MNVVGRVGSVISQGVYSVATPFHPFGGAVDIIAVEQPDGSYRSTPWYVRFGKFQGVLKGAEKVVTITVNGVEASFHMQLDNSGQAYFMRELVPGSEDSGIGSEEEAINKPEPPARSKSDGVLYISPSDRLDSQDLNVEHQEKQTSDDFESYGGYGRLEEAEDLPGQAEGGNSEVVLVSVDGHVLTAPISSTEGMEDMQLSDPQFHLGPGQGSNGDFNHSGEEWDAGILDDLYISQEKVKFESGHQLNVLIQNGEIAMKNDESHHILADKDETLHVSVNEDELLNVSVNEDEAHIVSTNEDEAHVVPINEDESHVVSANEYEAHVVSTNEDEDHVVSTNEDEVHDVSRSRNRNNDEVYQPMTSENGSHGRSENVDVGCQPLTTEDESCDVPVLEIDNDCKFLATKDEVCDLSNKDAELEDAGARLGKNDTFQSCLDLTSQIDDGDSGNELFSPGSDYHRDSDLILGNCSVAETDVQEGETKPAYFDQDALQEGADASIFTSEVDGTHNKKSSFHYGMESDLSPEGGSHNRSTKIASKVEAAGSDGLQSSMATSDNKLGIIPEHSEVEEEQNKEEHSKSHKGLGVEISLCGNMLQPGMGRESAEEAFQQHLVSEEDFKSDVLGQVMPLVGRDWSHSGVARLFSAIKENGYQLLFLSARAIVQAYLTKNFLFNLKQDGKALPNGPVVISPDGLFPSLYREVIRRAPHEFKIACLEDIKALFPSDYNPFYAGFGNRDTDELSYKKMGIPKGKIFIINPKGEVAVNSSVDVKSYTSLHTLVNDMFPPTTLVEQEDYNNWNYWKVPLPDVDL
nr:unnamed protein product [Digitaria exilis]